MAKQNSRSNEEEKQIENFMQFTFYVCGGLSIVSWRIHVPGRRGTN